LENGRVLFPLSTSHLGYGSMTPQHEIIQVNSELAGEKLPNRD